MTISPITTHVLDTALGKPAAGVAVSLAFYADDGWQPLAQGETNADGRIVDLLAAGTLKTGVYRVTFDTKRYYEAIGRPCFYPSVPIIFEITNTTEHYHVPLLLSPYGYSTYRGS